MKGKGSFTTLAAVTELRKEHSDQEILEKGVSFIQEYLIKAGWPSAHAIAKSTAVFTFIISGKDIDQ